jgi:hypothetical protein
LADGSCVETAQQGRDVLVVAALASFQLGSDQGPLLGAAVLAELACGLDLVDDELEGGDAFGGAIAAARDRRAE